MRRRTDFCHRGAMASSAQPGSPERVVDALVEEGLLAESGRGRARDVVARVLATPQAQPGRGLPRLVEVVAYLGGALVLAAGTLFMLQQWDTLGFGARVALVAVVTVALAASGIVTLRLADGPAALQVPESDARRRLTSTLLVGAAVAAGFLVGLVWDHLLPDSDVYPSIYWPVVAGGATLLIGSALSYVVAPSALGQVGAVAGALTAATNLVDGLAEEHTANYLGLSLFGIGVVWLALSEAGVLRERTVGRGIAAGLALLGGQVPVIGGSTAWLGYALTGVVVVAGVVLYLQRLAWPYLAAAVLGLTLVVPEMVMDWTEGSLGAVGGVLVAGLTLLVASYAGYRLRAEAEHPRTAH